MITTKEVYTLPAEESISVKMPLQLCKHRYLFVLVPLCLKSFGGLMIQQYFVSLHRLLCVS